MPGDNSGAEPREHERECLTNCPYISDVFVEEDSCVAGHADHFCNCDDVARIRWEADAFDAWERNNG